MGGPAAASDDLDEHHLATLPAEAVAAERAFREARRRVQSLMPLLEAAMANGEPYQVEVAADTAEVRALERLIQSYYGVVATAPPPGFMTLLTVFGGNVSAVLEAVMHRFERPIL